MTHNPFDRSDPVAPRTQDAGLRSLDLTGRERNLRQAMSTLSRIANAFARGTRRTLPFLVSRKSRLVPQSVAIANAPGSSPEEERLALHALLQEEAGQTWAMVSLNDISLGLILEGSLGAVESRGNFTFGRELTLAQRALSGRLIRALADDLKEALRAETETTPMNCVVFSTPRDSDEHAPGKDGLSVDCLVEGVPGAVITISVRAAALEGAAKDSEQDEEPQGDPRMHQVVQDVTVDVVAELGRVSMGLRSVLSLEVGQVLRLSTAVDDAVRVDVGGLKKFTGVPVVSRGQLAIEIRSRLGE
jgi:flagellar motor switch/type III secretory pathway protein FliN